MEGSGTPPGYHQIVHREFRGWIPPVPPIVTDANSANPGVEMLKVQKIKVRGAGPPMQAMRA